MAFELFELTGKRALVTGSSQGIGFALAQGLAEHGAEVVLNGRDAAKLDAAGARLAAAGHKVSVVGFDVTQAQAAKDGVRVRISSHLVFCPLRVNFVVLAAR